MFFTLDKLGERIAQNSRANQIHIAFGAQGDGKGTL
jgi:hypothetical protein